jgi:hypothetical protein
MLKRPSRAVGSPVPVVAAALTAAAVLGLGVAIDRHGPDALIALHALLGAVAAIGCLRAWQTFPMVPSRL